LGPLKNAPPSQEMEQTSPQHKGLREDGKRENTKKNLSGGGGDGDVTKGADKAHERKKTGNQKSAKTKLHGGTEQRAHNPNGSNVPPEFAPRNKLTNLFQAEVKKKSRANASETTKNRIR